MDGERKKRKMENEEEEEEEEEEEKKMEKFYALIRNTRDAIDRMRNTCNNEAKDQKQITKMELEEPKCSGIWNPTFQPEDFAEDHHHDRDDTNRKLNMMTMIGPSRPTIRIVDTTFQEGPSNARAEEAAAAAEEEEEHDKKSDKEDGGGDDNNIELDLTLSL